MRSISMSTAITLKLGTGSGVACAGIDIESITLFGEDSLEDKQLLNVRPRRVIYHYLLSIPLYDCPSTFESAPTSDTPVVQTSQ